MRVPKPSLGVVVAFVILSLLGAGVVYRITGSDTERGDNAQADGERPETSAGGAFATDIPIPVEGAEVVRDTLVIAVKADGQAAARGVAPIAAQVSGRVRQVLVRENQAVSEGQPLLLLDDTEYRLSVEEAEAAVRAAEAEYRSQTLGDDRIEDAEVRAERDRVARARSGLERAQVALKRAQMELARTAIRAPFAGRVSDLKVVQGQWVGAGTEVVTVANMDPIRVEARVLETEVPFLAQGRKAVVTFTAFPGEGFQGEIATINPMVEGDSRTARVTVTVPNPGGRIFPGMYAQISLDARRFPDRVMVPRSAILERDRRTMLFVYEGDESGGLAKWRYVTTGLENDTHVEIVENPETEMVQPGERVLTDGHYSLIHDARVRLVESVTAEGGRPQ